MCGIAGIVSRFAPPSRDLLERMTRTLAHRGPDGHGIVCDGPVGLGHRRLSIIDLATGAQPMSGSNGSTWITYNGEIYNFRELRRELESRGHRFRTTSDTEVILAAYETWGIECLGRLRGMFAFAIWDARRRQLLLASDRVGIKRAVYAWDGSRLLFASELKALLQDHALPRDLDWEALRDYFTYLYVPAPRTIFRGIQKLPPASWLTLDVDTGRLETGRYWDLHFEPREDRSDGEWLEGLQWHLRDAIRSHLVADVPVGAFLSGGLDSSSVVALMAQVATDRVRTFSIGFDDAGFDELAFARAVARRWETDHYELVVKADAMEAMPRLAWHFDEPFGDASALPTYFVSKITCEHVTVALSGDGGDENFAGYRRYADALAFHRMEAVPARFVKPLLRWLSRLLPPGVRGQGYTQLLAADPIARYFLAVTSQSTATLTRLLGREAQRQLSPTITPDWFRQLLTEGRPPDLVSALQYLDIRSYLPEDILTKVDRASMAVSLETRVPLLDHVLMEYLATMPSRLKLGAGGAKTILKKAMASELPAEVLARKKMGFGVPLATWFRGELAVFARDVLLDARTRQRGFVDPGAVARLLQEHAAGDRDRSSQIWALLCLELWARQWMDRT